MQNIPPSSNAIRNKENNTNIFMFRFILFLQIIGLLNAFTPQRSLEEFQDV